MDTLPHVLCEKIYDYVNDLYFIEHVPKLKESLDILVFKKKCHVGFTGRDRDWLSGRDWNSCLLINQRKANLRRINQRLETNLGRINQRLETNLRRINGR